MCRLGIQTPKGGQAERMRRGPTHTGGNISGRSQRRSMGQRHSSHPEASLSLNVFTDAQGCILEGNGLQILRCHKKGKTLENIQF